MAADIQSINQGIKNTAAGWFTTDFVTNALGWLLAGLLLVGGGGWVLWYYMDKKKYNRVVKTHEIINGFFVHTYSDVAMPVRIGKGGFEIIYLKKLKTWKIAHGARTGRNEYNFYIMRDGYWYPGQVKADVYWIDKNNGLIPIVTTNPTMRSQYTSLEKQIDDLHGQKTNFWDKYGTWVLTIGFAVVLGVFVWLSFREIHQFLGSGSALADKMNQLAESMNRLAVNLNNNQPSGLVPAGSSSLNRTP